MSQSMSNLWMQTVAGASALPRWTNSENPTVMSLSEQQPSAITWFLPDNSSMLSHGFPPDFQVVVDLPYLLFLLAYLPWEMNQKARHLFLNSFSNFFSPFLFLYLVVSPALCPTFFHLLYNYRVLTCRDPSESLKRKSHMVPFNSLKPPYTDSPPSPNQWDLIWWCHTLFFPFCLPAPQLSTSLPHTSRQTKRGSSVSLVGNPLVQYVPVSWLCWTPLPPSLSLPGKDGSGSGRHQHLGIMWVIVTVPSISSWAPSSQNWERESVLLIGHLLHICIFSIEVRFPGDRPWTRENHPVTLQLWTNRTSADKAVLLFSMISGTLRYSVSQPTHQSSRCVPLR